MSVATGSGRCGPVSSIYLPPRVPGPVGSPRAYELDNDEYYFEDKLGFFLIPFMYHGNGPKFTGGNVVSDCLMPEYATGKRNWDDADFKGSFPLGVQQKALRRWKDYGY
ncbi:hypothetical protein GGI42DRAFT_351680 [Trichoderma sp. SZMC 28013]